MKRFSKLLIALFLIMFVSIAGVSNTIVHAGVDDIVETLQKKFDRKIYEELETYSVSIFLMGADGIGRCSGVVIKEDEENTYILTAKHCIGVTEEVYVNNKKADIIISPIDEDLSLIIVKGKLLDKRPVKLATTVPESEDTIYHVGYPDFEVYESKGIVLFYTDDWAWAKIKVIPGCSGGGIFNKEKELVGIVWGNLRYEPIGIYESLNDINLFLDKVEKFIK